MTDWIGKTLGKVHIDLLLARGGMAEVYLGTHITLQRPVAVKLLHIQYQDDPDLLDRFQQEARVVAMLRHPNIVQVYDFDTVDGHPYLVMEYISGLSLSAYLGALHARNERLELPLISRLLGAIASALQYAHESGIIHRDVKPGNILLTSRTTPIEKNNPLPADVQAVLTDFGLVRFLNSARHTSTGMITGTPVYMSPEQARGETTDARTDIYSLGIVLYEILAGQVPFEAESTMGVLNKQINEPPSPIPGLAPAIQQIIDRALAKNKQDRFQTPLELSAAFDEAIHRQADALTLVPGKITSTFTEMSRNASDGKTRKNLFPYIVGGLAALAVASFLFFNHQGTSITPAPTSTAISADHGNPIGSSITKTATEASGTQAPYVEEANQIGILRFQDGAAKLDQVTMSAQNMPAPPKDTQYEVWLIEESGEQRRSIGVLILDQDGKGTVKFVDGQGRNLLERYNKMEITIEPAPDNNPNPSDTIAFSISLPPGGLVHVRHLLVAFGGAPNKTPLAVGLVNTTKLIDDTTSTILNAYNTGNKAATLKNAEAVLNLLVGNQSQDYRDWNADREITDPGDGFGLLLNGDNVGYIQGTYLHAGYSATAPDATDSMKVHGEHVKISAKNVEGWALILRDHMKLILESPFNAQLEQPIRESVALADEMLKGIDLNGNEQIEPIPGEGGALTAIEHAYYMADMLIFSDSQPK